MRVTIIILMLLSLFLSCKNSKSEKADMTAEQIVTDTIHIYGMTCTGCENTIKNAVSKLDGVKEVQASFMDSIAIVSFNSAKVSIAAINEKINSTGYTVVTTPATE